MPPRLSLIPLLSCLSCGMHTDALIIPRQDTNAPFDSGGAEADVDADTDADTDTDTDTFIETPVGSCDGAFNSDATATFSQVANFPDWPRYLVDYAIDSDRNGTAWAIYPQGGMAHTAVFELLSEVGRTDAPTALSFTLRFRPPGWELGRFRLSVTDAFRTTYGDGANYQGDIGDDSIWTILTPLTAVASSDTKLDILDDGSVRVDLSTYVVGEHDYTIIAETDLDRVTGIRLEALTDSSLPDNGPGVRADGSANFQLSDFRLDCTEGD
jgi:hypothetical protein